MDDQFELLLIEFKEFLNSIGEKNQDTTKQQKLIVGFRLFDMVVGGLRENFNKKNISLNLLAPFIAKQEIFLQKLFTNLKANKNLDKTTVYSIENIINHWIHILRGKAVIDPSDVPNKIKNLMKALSKDFLGVGIKRIKQNMFLMKGQMKYCLIIKNLVLISKML